MSLQGLYGHGRNKVTPQRTPRTSPNHLYLDVITWDGSEAENERLNACASFDLVGSCWVCPRSKVYPFLGASNSTHYMMVWLN